MPDVKNQVFPNSTATSSAGEGRIPPQAVGVEKAVLGAMLIQKEAAPKVIDVLDGASFYNPTHQKIYQAMISLFEKGEPIDAVTVVEELRRRGQLDPVEDPVYITQLTADITSAANVEYHARIVLEKALMRNLIAASAEVAARGYNETEDPLDLLDEAETKIFQISERRLKKPAVSIKVLIHDAIEALQDIHGKHGGITGVPTGFPELDNITGGFQKSDLVIIAGRPSHGKTAFALSLAKNAALHKEKPTSVAIFSLEMSEQQLIIRLLAMEAKVKAQELRTGRLHDDEWRRIPKAADKLSSSKMFIDDTAAIGILELRAKARRLKAEHGIGLVIVDYLQLIMAPKAAERREQEISLISRSLKALAKELNVPVIALSQLNRAVESRSDRRPALADLRESGAIEQDADVVMFVHRPEIYNITSIKDDRGMEIETIGKAEIIIGKQRNGPPGNIWLTFNKEHIAFERPVSPSIEALVPFPPGALEEEPPF